MRRSALLAVLLGTVLLLLPESGAAAGGRVLAEVDGEAITAEAVDRAVALPLAEFQGQLYELKRRKLEELISETLLRREAARRRVSVPELLDAEVTAKTGPVTDQEIETFYRENRARLSGDDKAVRERIRSFLQAQRLAAEREAFLQKLRSQSHVVVRLNRPPPVRVAVDPREGAAVKGPPGAPVAVVEFSDFQCPFCKKALAELERVLAAYPTQVRLIYRHLPLEGIHPQARGAAEAAECASTQGRFWEYHDRIFAEPEDLSPAKLRRLAEEVRLNLEDFEQCLTQGQTRAAVAQDTAVATRLGLTGTPTFFINGRPIQGAQPFQAFRAIIDEELLAPEKAPR